VYGLHRFGYLQFDRCSGNHEWDCGWVRQLLRVLEDSGVKVLRNDYARISIGTASIILAGVDDPYGPADMKTPEQLLPEIRKKEGDAFIVLLAHRNNYLDRFSALGVDFVLCGHAHGGQIRLPLIGGLFGPSSDFFPPYTSGVYTEGGTKMLVSRGIGNHTRIPRFLNNPEIPVAVLKIA
jgi:predicted MPP superfamily phosphohydrolase